MAFYRAKKGGFDPRKSTFFAPTGRNWGSEGSKNRFFMVLDPLLEQIDPIRVVQTHKNQFLGDHNPILHLRRSKIDKNDHQNRFFRLRTRFWAILIEKRYQNAFGSNFYHPNGVKTSLVAIFIIQTAFYRFKPHSEAIFSSESPVWTIWTPSNAIFSIFLNSERQKRSFCASESSKNEKMTVGTVFKR